MKKQEQSPLPTGDASGQPVDPEQDGSAGNLCTRGDEGEAVSRKEENLMVREAGLERQIKELECKQQKLEASLARYYELYDLAPLSYLTIDSAGKILETNRTFANFLGVSGSTLVGEHLHRIIFPEDRNICHRFREQLFSTGVPQKAPEFRLTKADGSPVWMRMECKMVEEEGGGRTARIMLADIAEHKREEEALRKSEEKLRSIADYMVNWEVWFGVDGKVLWVSPAVERISGYSPAEILAMPDFIATMIAEEDRDRVRVTLQEALCGSTGEGLEIRLVPKNGSKLWLDVSWQPVFDAEGRSLGTRASCRDVTACKQAEAALREREVFERDVLDSLPAHIAVLDKEGMILAVNEPWLQFAKANGNPDAGKIGEKVNYLEVCRATAHDGDFYAKVALEGLQAVLSGKQKHFTLEYPCDAPDCPRWFAMEIIRATGNIAAAIIAHTDISERKKAEAALQESETRYRALFDRAHDGVFLLSFDGEILLVNQAFATMHGYSVEEMNSKKLGDLDTPETSRLVPERMRRLQAGEALTFEVEHYHKDGHVFPLEVSACRITSGGKSFLQAIHRDISERKRAEAALRESEMFLREAQTIAGMGSYVLDIPSGVWRSSEVLDKVFGIDRKFRRNVEGWVTLLHPDDRIMLSDYFHNEVVGKGGTFDKEYRIVRHDDKAVRWVHGMGKLDYDAQGHPIRMVGTIQDITEHRREEEQLRNLRTAVEQSANSIIITDANGIIEYVNPAFQKASGYSAAEVLGGNPHILKSGEQSDAFYRELWTTIKAGQIWRGQFHNKRKDGALYWESATISPILNAGGEPVRFLAVKEDITERKNMEIRLREALERAESANRAKSEFLANMSHEIRTPMSGVIGMTDLLLGTEQSAEQREYTQAIHTCSDSLLSLINDILDFSKVEAGQLVLENLDFDIHTTLEEAIEVLAMNAQEKGLEIVCMIGGDVPEMVRGDPGRLRQVLFNLVGNAIKFTQMGGVTVRVDLSDETETAATLRFVVSDTGIGIPQDKQEAIFSKFVQADPSMTRKFGGSGLGLAIARQIIHLFQGEIGVESEEGQGAKFTFTAVFGKPLSGAFNPFPRESVFPEAKLLVVDDFKTNREFMMKLLRDWGCRCEGVPDGASALALLKEAVRTGDPFAAAFVDMRMPSMDGAELARLIKGDRGIQSTRLVMLTSLGKQGDVQRLAGGGFSCYLTKPVRPAMLRKCLAVVMEKQESGASGRFAAMRNTAVGHGRLRILVVEDNMTNRTIAIKMLEKLGHAAGTAVNGKEAVDILRREHYDLVFMDCQMPLMDGFEATRTIRDPSSGVKNPRIPIIALTAHAMKGDRDLCFEAGMNEYVSKPTRIGNLEDAIRRCCPGVPHSHGEILPSLPVDEEGHVPQSFDREGYLERTLGDRGLAIEVAEAFLADAPELVEKLSAAISAGDAAAAGKYAHTLKGSGSNMGGEILSEIAAQMQTAGKEGNLSLLREFLPRVQKAFQTLCTCLMEEFDLPDKPA